MGAVGAQEIESAPMTASAATMDEPASSMPRIWWRAMPSACKRSSSESQWSRARWIT